MASERFFSRRGFLGVLAGTAGASILAACSSPSRRRRRPSRPSPPSRPSRSRSRPSQRPPLPMRSRPRPRPPASKPAEAAKPAAGAPVVVWQPLDFLPQVTGLMNERFTAVSKEKGITLNFEELPSGAASTDRFKAAVQAGTPPDVWRNFDYENQFWRIQGQTRRRLRHRQPGQGQGGRVPPASQRDADPRGQVLGRPDGRQLLAVPRSAGPAGQGRHEVPEELGRGPDPGQGAVEGAALLLRHDPRQGERHQQPFHRAWSGPSAASSRTTTARSRSSPTTRRGSSPWT